MKPRIQEAVPTSSTKDFHSTDECSRGEVGRIDEPEGGKETKVESIRDRERHSVSGKEGPDKGLCGFCQLQREEPNYQNTMEALPAEQKSWTTPHLKPVETSRQKRHIPKEVGVGKEKMVANQTMVMTVDPTGKKAVVTSQSMKCSSQVKKESEDMLKSKEKEPEYSPQSEEKKPEYSPYSK